jgi:hypothetical protein
MHQQESHDKAVCRMTGSDAWHGTGFPSLRVFLVSLTDAVPRKKRGKNNDERNYAVLYQIDCLADGEIGS